MCKDAPSSSMLRLRWSPLQLPSSAATSYELPKNVALVTLQTGRFLGSPQDAMLLRLAHMCGHPSPGEDCGSKFGGTASVSICRLLGRPSGHLSITETTVTANRALVDSNRLRFRTETRPLCFKKSRSACPEVSGARSSTQTMEGSPSADGTGSHQAAAGEWQERWKDKSVNCDRDEGHILLRSLEVRAFVVHATG